MTSSTFDTERHDQYFKAIKEFRKALLKGEKPVVHLWYRDHKINSNTLRALRDLEAVTGKDIARGGAKGHTNKWIYKNNIGTDELDNSLIVNLFKKLNEYTKEYDAVKQAKKKGQTGKITTAIVQKETCSYHNVNHQIVFMREELEKEKLVKGYFRPEQLNFMKGILKSLENMKLFSELALESLGL
jgi:hypothetical protein